MSTLKDTDRAIRNLLKWSDRPEWASRRRAVFEEHLGGASARRELGVEDLLAAIEESGHFPMVMGVAFEDFASRPPEQGAPNVVDEYLQRRGWRESPNGRRYLARLRDSVLSLYEVVDVDPGRSVVVRDLLRGGGRMLVHEKLGTAQLARWDRFAARVIKMGERRVFTGGMMHFARRAGDDVMRLLDRAPAPVREWVAAQPADGEPSSADPPVPDVVDAFVRERCGSFTEIWLVDFLERRDSPLPELVTSDGEPLLFGEVRFPVQKRRRSDVAAAMDAGADWDRAAADLPTWIWREGARTPSLAKRGVAVQSQSEDGRAIVGTAELRDDALVFTANSRERTERGTAVLEALVGDHIGTPATSFQSPQSMLARDKGSDDAKPSRSATPGIDEEAKRRALGKIKDDHYRRVIDEPIPALDGKSPRACARSKRDRAKAVAWLKELENLEQRAAARGDPGAYDTAWIWDELGLGAFRSRGPTSRG